MTSRRFTASAPFGTISTQEAENVGKVLRFDGDLPAIHAIISRCHPSHLLRAHRLVVGQLSFGKYVTNGFAIPVELLPEAMRKE
jgi:hypothetical protein